MLEFFSTCRIEDEIGLDVVDTLSFQLGGARRCMTWRQFILSMVLHTAVEMAEDGFGAYYMDRGAANVPYLLAQYLFRHTEGRKSGARLSRGHFIGRLAHHFGLVSDDGLRGLSVVARPERQQVAAAGAARDAPAIDEGMMDRIKEDVHEIRRVLVEQREVIDAMARDFSRFTIWAASGIAYLLNFARVTYTLYSKTHVPYQRRVRRRTDGASNSVAKQDQQQPDP
ncbi:hypothetical protein Tco_0946121 [Tanacetum coccineum]